MMQGLEFFYSPDFMRIEPLLVRVAADHRRSDDIRMLPADEHHPKPSDLVHEASEWMVLRPGRGSQSPRCPWNEEYF